MVDTSVTEVAETESNLLLHFIASPAMAIVQKQRETATPSSPKMKQRRPWKKEKLLRRKVWVSNTQTSTSYDQGAVDSLVLSRSSIKSKRTTIDSLYNDLEVQAFVMAQAKEVQEQLSPTYPSLIKVMLPSHVTGGFWLGLPKGFCGNHMPKQDTAIILEDESGTEYETKYLSEKTGLSAGWRGFSIAHTLLQGDVIVFHLVMPNKFMVYIVRSNAAAEVDGGLGLECEACNKQVVSSSKERNIANIKEEQTTLETLSSKETNLLPVKEEENENPVSLLMDIHKEHKQTSSHAVLDTGMMSLPDELENDSKNFGYNFMGGIQLSDSTLDFNKVKSLNDFSISVNGLIMDSEFSKHIRTKYYELCCSQKSFLHDHILEGLNYKLVSGIISETINIADAIRACKITTSKEHLATWDKTLTAFEELGMNIGFLRARIDQLLNFSLKPEKKREVELKRDVTQVEINMLVAKIMEARGTLKRLEAEIHTLDTDIKNMEQLFQEVASAPW